MFRACLVAAVVSALWTSIAVAAPVTLLEVGGSGNTGQFIDANEAAAVEFSLGHAFSNISIAADLFCVDCSGEILLMRGAIGPTADLTNFVTGAFFDVTSAVNPLLSGLDLGAGNYFLIVAMTRAGAVGWTGSDAPVFTSVAGVFAGLNYFASTLDAVAFNSNYSAITSSRGLHFSVSADEGSGLLSTPPTLLLFGAGLALLAFSRRRTE